MKRLLFFVVAAGVFFSGLAIPAEASSLNIQDRYIHCISTTEDPVRCGSILKDDQDAGVIYPPNLGDPDSNGYYRFPEPENGEYAFTWFSWEYLRCGSRELIGAVYTAAIEFKREYPDATIQIGELNAPGHRTHNRGISADVSGWENSAQAVHFGKALVDTGHIDYILYNRSDVIEEVNAYAARMGEDAPMKYQRDHSHFHINVDEEFAGSRSTKCGRNW